MAGYGTTLIGSSEFDPLIRALLIAAQRRARASGLRMRYRRYPKRQETEWELNVHGNGFVIAAWSQQLERDLPVVAEGYTGAGAGAAARNVATSLVSRWVAWCVGEEEDTTISANGRDAAAWIWPVIEFPPRTDALGPRLQISDSLIARWLVGDLPDEVAIEELHTVVEGLLRQCLALGRGPNWPSLLTRAEGTGLITARERSDLEDFNSLYRNRLKHRAKALSSSERVAVKDALTEVIMSAERLLGRYMLARPPQPG